MQRTIPLTKPTDFCAMILTHGRPDRVYTFDTLRKHGYTGDIYLVIDDQDEAGDEYRRRYGDRVLTFSKAEVAPTFDEGDNFPGYRGVIYARNACFDLARQVGKTYFIQLDDDYLDFRYKTDDLGAFIHKDDIRDLDAIFGHLVECFKAMPVLSIALAQGGDFIGGADGSFATSRKPRRKAMNSFICSTERPFPFFGRINEDVNVYTTLGFRGGLFFTVCDLALQQKQTQSNAGGMTELYLDAGTYVKSFYSILYMPSSVKIAEMGSTHRRLHHRISWDNTVPMILDEAHKKAAA